MFATQDMIDSVPGSAGQPILVAIDLQQQYGLTTALDQVSLTIHRGEFLVITGPSGSGKSTLLQCLAGIQTPERGSVAFNDQLLGQLDEDRRTILRRRHFGFVFQFPLLIAELPVLDNVALPLLLDGSRLSPARSIAHRWIERLGITDLTARFPSQLSGGQQQLVAVARALVLEPQIIFADEPTSSLDSQSGERVMNALKQAADQMNTAVVIVTHDMSVIPYASRHIVLQDGTILCSRP